MKITRTTIAALAATGAVGLAAGPVLAQDATDATEESTRGAMEDPATTPPASDHAGPGGFARGSGVDLAEELAAELDLDVDDVTVALDAIRDRVEAERAAEREARRADMEEARAQALQDAVTAGEVTQEQADLLSQLWADGAAAAEDEHLAREDLTEEQLAALGAFRDAAGEVAGMGGHGGRPGGPGGFGGRMDRPGDDEATADAPADATVQESVHLTA